MKIGIIEDDQKELDNLLNCIHHFFSNKDLSYQIDVYNNPDTLIQDIDEIDLVFLDIQIKHEKNGIDIGIELRKKNKDVKIIFVTNYSQFLIEGYKANANRYFIKPISQEHFDIEISNVIEDYLLNSAGFADYKICKNKIYYQDILYVEFIDRKTILHLLNGKQIPTNYPLKYWLDKLKLFPFSQTYKSIIVNLNHISGFTKKDIMLVNDEIIPVSKHFRKNFEEAYVHNMHKRL